VEAASRTVPLYVVDAFTDRRFGGNPAAVVLNERWLKDGLLQAIAAENNLSETAFLVPREDGDWDLRWFTPRVEVDLCGHATLASAFVLFEEVGEEGEEGPDLVRFHTRSGVLPVRREGGCVVLDFPALPASPCAEPPGLAAALGVAPAEVHATASSWMVVLEDEAEVRALAPDFAALERLGRRVIATAPCRGRAHFVSRFFAPSVGVPEDPVTGSAHCTLTPYWAQRLGTNPLEARQLSRRGGTLYVEDRGERVGIAGHAVLVTRGEMRI
jgi:PhzF family phenazine biosynthesis protein